MEIRKIVTQVEETRRSAGRELVPPTRKVVVAAVVRDPLAGRYAEDL
ncbi:MAG TPA: amino acid synthesis family protein, partial [Candidatus Dormibacteraeota bacterium]|nr:amino acid synthesis family protein [Candidatus Dormibacteraeota bacterium]